MNRAASVAPKMPGQRWQVVLYLDNNSANPVIECSFKNAGTIVMNTRATVARTAPGVRQGLVISARRSTCSSIAPPATWSRRKA